MEVGEVLELVQAASIAEPAHVVVSLIREARIPDLPEWLQSSFVTVSEYLLALLSGKLAWQFLPKVAWLGEASFRAIRNAHACVCAFMGAERRRLRKRLAGLLRAMAQRLSRS
jgi:hypothetical protein